MLNDPLFFIIKCHNETSIEIISVFNKKPPWPIGKGHPTFETWFVTIHLQKYIENIYGQKFSHVILIVVGSLLSTLAIFYPAHITHYSVEIQVTKSTRLYISTSLMSNLPHFNNNVHVFRHFFGIPARTLFSQIPCQTLILDLSLRTTTNKRIKILTVLKFYLFRKMQQGVVISQQPLQRFIFWANIVL